MLHISSFFGEGVFFWLFRKRKEEKIGRGVGFCSVNETIVSEPILLNWRRWRSSSVVCVWLPSGEQTKDEWTNEIGNFANEAVGLVLWWCCSVVGWSRCLLSCIRFLSRCRLLLAWCLCRLWLWWLWLWRCELVVSDNPQLSSLVSLYVSQEKSAKNKQQNKTNRKQKQLTSK